jgi:protein TonB
MSSLLYALNIGTLATWLTVAGASAVAAVVHVNERLPLLDENRREETELSVTPLAMGSAPPAEAAAEDAAEEAPAEPQEVEPAALAELPETPEMPALPDLSELEPLPEIPEMPVAPAPAEVRREAAPKVAVRAAAASSSSTKRAAGQRQTASAASGRGSGQGNGSARGAGSSAVGSNRWLGLRKASPVYPAAAKRQGQQGRVLVQFTVDERGNVVDARVTGPSPYPLLNQEALRTIRRFKAKPGVRATTSQPIIFQLH